MIETQVCWWCGRGPFVSLVSHTWAAHGVYARDLRRLARLLKNVPTVSDELRAIRRSLPQVKTLAPRRDHPMAPREYSEAGLIVVKRTLWERFDQMSEADRHDWHAAGGRAVGKSRQRPHPCVVCGEIVPTTKPKTCSSVCRSAAKARAASISMRERIAAGTAPAPPAMTDERRLVLSKKQKANWRAGVFKDRTIWQRARNLATD